MADEFDRFVIAMEKRGEEVTEGALRARREGFNAIAENVVLSTPVLTGLARGNWRASRNVAVEGVIERFDPSGASAIAEAASVAAVAKDGDTLILSNSVPYIGRLNDGSSPQQPAGFVERAVAAGQSRANSVKIFRSR